VNQASVRIPRSGAKLHRDHEDRPDHRASHKPLADPETDTGLYRVERSRLGNIKHGPIVVGGESPEIETDKPAQAHTSEETCDENESGPEVDHSLLT
jgi:hypothetical protein